jgi:hypothetical protein
VRQAVLRLSWCLRNCRKKQLFSHRPIVMWHFIGDRFGN